MAAKIPMVLAGVGLKSCSEARVVMSPAHPKLIPVVLRSISESGIYLLFLKGLKLTQPLDQVN